MTPEQEARVRELLQTERRMGVIAKAVGVPLPEVLRIRREVRSSADEPQSDKLK